MRTGPACSASLAVRSARVGSRAVVAASSAASSLSSAAGLTRGAVARSVWRSGPSSWAQPAWTSCVSSVVRANPPIRAAAPARWARSASTSRAFGYGAWGSACRSSPSSQSTTRPRSPHRGEHRGPGARDDQGLAAQCGEPAAVPLRRAEIGGERDVAGGCVPWACRVRRALPAGTSAASASSTRARSRASGTTMTAPRPRSRW